MKMKASILSYFILNHTIRCGIDAFTQNIHTPFSVTTNPKIKYQKTSWTATQQPGTRSSTSIYNKIDDEEKVDSDIGRLKSMAAKLRAEAASLEAERAESIAQAAQKAFEKFDINKDGEVSLLELKEGLEKELKTDLSEARVKSLMNVFDATGDGKLQLDEFVTIDRFRNKLAELVRDEKVLAVQAKKAAGEEEALSKATEAILEQINDRPPTGADKALSVLPYLFPLLDGLQFAGPFLGNNENPIAAVLALLYVTYRSIPFAGFIAFFALSTLSGNFGINRLVRYNMQQAIYLDIALFFPGLLAALVSVTGVQIPNEVIQLTTGGVFIVLLLALAYCVTSSVLGVIPNKIPIISDAVEKRIPTADSIDFSLFKLDDKDKENDKKKDDDEKK